MKAWCELVHIRIQSILHPFVPEIKGWDVMDAFKLLRRLRGHGLPRVRLPRVRLSGLDFLGKTFRIGASNYRLSGKLVTFGCGHSSHGGG